MNMQFISFRQQSQNNNLHSAQPIHNMITARIHKPIHENPHKQLNHVTNPVELPKRMKWGEPTWFLFHVLAYKIKDEHFNNLKNELLEIINMICVNLPCPTCASHATDYMNKIQRNSIQYKQNLKDMLFKFHNDVNVRKGVQSFPHDKLDEKYSKANTMNIIQHFMTHFQDKHHSIHMIANDMHRGRIVKLLKVWFNNNIQHFDL